jgi:hypothetical protein
MGDNPELEKKLEKAEETLKTEKAKVLLLESNRWTEDEKLNTTRVKALVACESNDDMTELLESWNTEAQNNKPVMRANGKSKSKTEVSEAYRKKYFKNAI